MECPVCYEMTSKCDYQELECTHSLCKLCLKRLQQNNCPLCRNPITNNYNQLPANTYDWSQDDELNFNTIHIPRIQRRRRRRDGTRNRNLHERIPLIIPIISENDIDEIITPIITDKVVKESENDNARQKVRNGRHRWRRQNTHTSSRYCTY